MGYTITDQRLTIDQILDDPRLKAIMPKERAMLINRDGTPIAKVEPPQQSMVQAGLDAETRRLLQVKPELSVAHAAATLERVWANPIKFEPSGTCLRRNTREYAPASGSSILGVPVVDTAGNQYARAEKIADPSLADSWLTSAVAARVGPFEPFDFKLRVTMEAGEEHGPAGLEQCEVLNIRMKDTLKQMSTTIKLLVDMTAMPIVLYDVYLEHSDYDLESRYPSLYSCVGWMLGGVHRACRSGKWQTVNANYVQYAERMSDIISGTVPNSRPSIAHLILDDGTAAHAPEPDAFSSKVPLVHQDVMSGLSSGVVAAGDVPPSLITYLGVGDDAITSYSVMRVISPTGRGMHVCKYGKATGKPQFASGFRARTPCVRDGLLSVGLTNAMTGDGTGAVFVKLEYTDSGELASTPVQTVWSDSYALAMEGDWSGGVVKTRDRDQAWSAMAAYASMQDWAVGHRLQDGQIVMTADTPIGELIVSFWYSPTKGPRWLECVSTVETVDVGPIVDTYTTEYPSELALDYWVSGMARYTVAEHTRHGAIATPGLTIVEPGHGLFPKLKHKSLKPPRAAVNVTVTAERVNVKVDGKKAHYVYSLGIAVCKKGGLICAGEGLDHTLTPDHVDEMTKLPPGQKIAMMKQAQGDTDRIDVPQTLLWLRDLQRKYGDVRIYSSGAHDVAECMEVQHPKNLAPDKPMIREIGALLSDTKSVGRKLGWANVEGAGQLAVLQSISSGLLQVTTEPTHYQHTIGSIPYVQRELIDALDSAGAHNANV